MARKYDESKGEFCVYGARYLSRVYPRFRDEMNWVREGKDPEAIHRMRVASRRLRAGLPVFARCFPPRTYRKISGGIRRITKDLGDARDLDVQINYLEGILAAHAGIDEQATDGCTILLSRIRARREALQPKVIADCMKLEKKGIIDLMETNIRSWKKQSGPSKRALPGVFPVRRAQKAIERRIDTLEAYSPKVQDPGAVEAHHAMRIAAKKLRYLLEVYSSLYGKELGVILRRLKRLQEILGNLHDCDVWISDLLEARVRERKNPGGMDPALAKGMAFVLRDRRKARRDNYRLLKEEWKDLVDCGLFFRIREIAGQGRETVPPALSPGNRKI